MEIKGGSCLKRDATVWQRTNDRMNERRMSKSEKEGALCLSLLPRLAPLSLSLSHQQHTYVRSSRLRTAMPLLFLPCSSPEALLVAYHLREGPGFVEETLDLDDLVLSDWPTLIRVWLTLHYFHFLSARCQGKCLRRSRRPALGHCLSYQAGNFGGHSLGAQGQNQSDQLQGIIPSSGRRWKRSVS